MKMMLAIAGREILSNFVTPVAYVVMSAFVLLSAFFFFTLVTQFNTVLGQAAMIPNIHPNLNEYVVVPYYQTLAIVLIFMVPVLTMRSIAEERRSGTFELLVTSPLRISDIVFGKFIGVAAVVTVMLLMSFVFPLVLVLVADPEAAPIFVGFLGLLLCALAFVSLGITVSAATRSQTVAGVVGLVVLLIFYIIDAPAGNFSSNVAGVLNYLAPSEHIDTFFKGVVAGRNVVYFLSVIALGLFAANRVLDAQRWR